MITARDHIAAMASYALADLTPPQGKRLISLAQNESLRLPSPTAIAAARDALASSALYPDPDWSDLRSAIGEVHRAALEAILCGAGSMELIGCIVQCFAGSGDEVLASEYSYAFFRTATQVAQADYVAAAEENLTVSVDALLGAVSGRTRVVFVANPGNPTGTVLPLPEIVRLRDALPDGVLLVIDEAYGEFADMPGNSTFDLVERGNTIVLRTFSKAYGLAGLRVGWGLFPPGIAAEVRKLLNPNNISIASQVAAAAAMRDQSYMRETCRQTGDQRDGFGESVRRLGLHVPQSSTNFVLIGFETDRSAQLADAALRDQGIFMRGMAGYGLAHALRATIAGADDMRLALDVLSDFCTKETQS